MGTTIFEIKDHVAYIKLNRPESMNALNPELKYALSQHFDEVEKNKDIWLKVISSRGVKAYSSKSKRLCSWRRPGTCPGV